jgi:hypothetical protein
MAVSRILYHTTIATVYLIFVWIGAQNFRQPALVCSNLFFDVTLTRDLV